jgi:hypothetical protein
MHRPECLKTSAHSVASGAVYSRIKKLFEHLQVSVIFPLSLLNCGAARRI